MGFATLRAHSTGYLGGTGHRICLCRDKSPVWIGGNTTRSFNKSASFGCKDSDEKKITIELHHRIWGNRSDLICAARIGDLEKRTCKKLEFYNSTLGPFPKYKDGTEAKEGVRLKILDLFLKHAAFTLEPADRESLFLDVPLDKAVFEAVELPKEIVAPGATMGAIITKQDYNKVQKLLQHISSDGITMNGFVLDYVIWNSRNWFVENLRITN